MIKLKKKWHLYFGKGKKRQKWGSRKKSIGAKSPRHYAHARHQMKDDGNALPISPWKTVFGWVMMPLASLEGHESRPLAGACLARVNIFVLIIFILIKRPNHLRLTYLLHKNQYKKDKKTIRCKFIIFVFCFEG